MKNFEARKKENKNGVNLTVKSPKFALGSLSHYVDHLCYVILFLLCFRVSVH